MTPTTPDLHGVYEKLGEITATLRDVSHTGRNNAQKIDALAEVVIKQGALRDTIDRHGAIIDVHHERLSVLEIDLHHRQGAIGLLAWFSRHWPLTLILVAGSIFIAWANGRIAV